MLRVCTVSGSLILLCLGTALAQESRGTIAGRVADVQDAGIPHARVIITNVETGQKVFSVVELLEWARAIGFDPKEALRRLQRTG